MGFLDKVKNMFTEEVEDDDVKVEQIKNEVTHVSIESQNSKVDDYNEEDTSDFSFKAEEKLNKPVFFDDNDFKDLNLSPKEEKKPEPIKLEKEIYGSKIVAEKEVEEKKIFKPTPIISPVYGVLDKNYHKEDIVSRNDTKPIENDLEPSIDSIRNKAYGTLEDELENTLFGTNSILFKKDTDEEEKTEIEEVDGDVLSNLTDDISKELDELLIRKEKYIDDVKEEKKDDELNDEDLLGFIDSTLYKEGDE